MTVTTTHLDAWRHSVSRKLLWAGAVALLMLPAVAMRFTDEVNWTLSDFVFMGVLLALAATAVEVGMRLSGDGFYRFGALAAVAGGFLTVWVNVAVGMIGSEDHAANLLYGGVILAALIGAVLARFRPRGMMAAMLAAAAVHVAIGIAALALRWTDDPPQTVGITGVFAMPWLVAAAAFRAAAGRSSRPGPAAR